MLPNSCAVGPRTCPTSACRLAALPAEVVVGGSSGYTTIVLLLLVVAL